MAPRKTAAAQEGMTEDRVREIVKEEVSEERRASVTSNERQLFAAMAMQGMLADTNCKMTAAEMAVSAVEHADALADRLKS